MSTGTSLVHPDTAKLTPEEQKKGIYQYTPPEVLAYFNREKLSDEDLDIVHAHFGYLPDIPQPLASPVASNPEPAAPAQRRVQSPEAIAAPYGSTPARRLVKKQPEAVQQATILDVAILMAGVLPNDAAWALLSNLAKRFDLEIE